MEPIRRITGQLAAPLSIIGAVGGFINDVLAPLVNLAAWVAVLSLIGALVAFMAFLGQRRRLGSDAWQSRAAVAFVLAAASTLIFGGWSVVQASGPERGYLAQNIDPIAQIQAQLLNLQEDVTEIKETTTQTVEQVEAVATAQADGFEEVEVAATAQAEGFEEVEAVATAQAEGFAGIQAAFAALQAGEGTIVTNPTTPQEWYSNARLYQLRGDTANAIQAYEGYFSFNLEYVDPYLQYSDLLKATEGIARARQIVGDMFNARPDSLTLDLISARLLDSQEERLDRLTALAARAPQYGPVFFELGQEYDRALRANVTSDLLTKQGEAYDRLAQLEEQQLFSRYYIDKVLAEQQLADARQMRESYANAEEAFGTVDIHIYYYYNGVQFILLVPELYSAQKVVFSIDDPQPATDAGKNPSGFANGMIGPVPVPVGEHTFYMQYTDVNGVASQVYSKPFRVDPIAINYTPQPRDFSTNTVPATFAVGVVGAAADELYTYHYSLDSEALDQNVLGAGGGGAISLEGLTDGNHTLYVQAEAQDDGERTDVVEFEFTVE